LSSIELTYYHYALLSIPKIHTDLLWDLSILFSGLCLLYFGIIFFFRNKLAAKTRIKVERRKQLAPIISNFLFYGEDASKEEKYEYIELKVEIRQFIKDPINRNILKEILLDLQKDLDGDARNRLFKLYQDFDLHLDAYTKLNSWRWEVISQGILELTQMQVEQSYSFIKKFINHRRSVIRKQAQIAAVSLKHEGISYFLDTNKYHISEWQQIKVLEVLRNKEDFIPPKFGAWLTSKNKDVVLFALRLIKYYNQIDSNISIIELVKHKDDEVKQAAIQCIKEFGIANATGILKVSLWKCGTETKILILDAIGSLGKKEDLEFLYRVYNRESNFNVRSKALSAINAIAPDTVLPKEHLDTSIKIEDPIDMPMVSEEIPAAIKPLEEMVEVTEDKTLEPDAEDPPQEETITHEIAALDQEDLEIFDICFMEELNEILNEEPDKDDNLNENDFLPLDFLPIVEQKQPSMSKKKNKRKSTEAVDNLDVIFEHVHPDENFRKELEDILSRIEIPDENGNTEVEYLDFKFLPFVVSHEEENGALPELPADINDLEVICEEIGIDRPFKESIEELPEYEVETVSLNDEIDTCLMVDWEGLQEESKTKEPEQEPVFQTEPSIDKKDTPKNFGFSIFEELFRYCDTESKLILLDEIVDLGDEKELYFVQSLFKDPKQKVRKKARIIEGQLTARLKKEASENGQTQSYITWKTPIIQKPLLEFNFELDQNEVISSLKDKKGG